MIRYGLILSVVGTLVCVTALAPSAPLTPIPKDVKEICGTDEVTLDEEHSHEEKVTMSHLGSCKNTNVKNESDVTRDNHNSTEQVNKERTIFEDDFKEISKDADESKDLNNESNVTRAKDVVDDEETNFSKESEVELLENVTITKILEEQTHSFVKPANKKNDTTETERKQCNATETSKPELETDQKENETVIKTKIASEKSGEPKIDKESGKSRKRNDVSNENTSNEGDAKNEPKIKTIKNKQKQSGKTKKLQNEEKVSETNSNEAQTNTYSKVEKAPKNLKNKLDKSRKRREVQNAGEVNENSKQNQAENAEIKQKRDNKNGKKVQTKSDKQKGQNKSHQSKKQRDVKGKSGKSKNSHKTKHSKRSDGKTKKGSQKS